jgi:hypothetical protein
MRWPLLLPRNRRSRLWLAIAAICIYSLAVYWSRASYIPDPNRPPPSAGIQTRLKPPYAAYNDFSVRSGEMHGIFEHLADDGEADFSSPIELWENATRLGPAHSALKDIVGSGGGRFFFRRGEHGGFLAFSASDNTNPMTNGRIYWIVNPTR